MTGYKVYNFKTRKVEVARHVRVNEDADISSLMPALQQQKGVKLEIENLYDLDGIENIIIPEEASANMVNRELLYQEAVTGTEAMHYRKAIQDELDIIELRNAWYPVKGEKQHLINLHWVFT